MTQLGCYLMFVLVTMTSVVMVSPVAGIRVKVIYKLENVLTCYTCPQKSNNTDCNKWAPDVFCPYKHTVCKTVHRFNAATSESISVEKSCALPEQCSIETIGCKQTGRGAEMECTSCCTESYCNKAVPINVISTLRLSDSVILNNADNGAGHTTRSSWCLVVVTVASLAFRLLS